MLIFGPISSLFDFITFAIMLGPLHAGADLFRSGWFVESLATQTLIVFVIRTRRVPFFRSRPSRPLIAAVFTVVAVAIALPLSPFSHTLGFAAPPLAFYLALIAMVAVYLVLVEVAKRAFVGVASSTPAGRSSRRPSRHEPSHRLHRRAARFSAARVNVARVNAR
jgi:Mg2+-importing ATPase